MSRIACVISLLFLAAGCVGPKKGLFPPASGAATRTVYVVNQGGRHTGIAVERADIPVPLWPTKDDYPQARYLEVGWGDDDGYRKDLTFWIVLKGLFWPTRSVLQLDGFSKSLDENFDNAETTIIEVQLSEAGFERLCRHISDTHALDASGKPIALGDDWYRARGKYCIFKTCNTWVASGLRAAGCPITPAWCITRGPLLYQTGKFGHVVRRPTKETRDMKPPP
jgi:uncharacterized protein (TIGR02117 family)